MFASLPVAIASDQSQKIFQANQATMANSAPVAIASDQTYPFMQAEDAAHSSGDKGVMALGVRNDSLAALPGSDLDYSPFATDKAGQVRVRQTPPTGNILAGSTTTDTGTIITVPANKVWRGSISVSAGDSNAIGAAGSTTQPNVAWTPGAGGTAAFNAAHVSLVLPATLLSGVIGAWSTGTVSVSDVVVYAGTGSGTLKLNLNGATAGQGSAMGVLEDTT